MYDLRWDRLLAFLNQTLPNLPINMASLSHDNDVIMIAWSVMHEHMNVSNAISNKIPNIEKKIVFRKRLITARMMFLVFWTVCQK
jgi:hypothetical protein